MQHRSRTNSAYNDCKYNWLEFCAYKNISCAQFGRTCVYGCVYDTWTLFTAVNVLLFNKKIYNYKLQ